MIRTDYPFAVETVDPAWITLGDGTRIATTLWRPKTDRRVPIVVEMVPYRRRDGTVARDLDMDPLSWRLEARECGRLVHSDAATRRIRRDFA